MKANSAKPAKIDEYIATFPAEVQQILERVRATIRKAAPKAEEGISYQIPTFKLKGSAFIYFAAYKKHIALYPAPRGATEFKQELAAYAGGKGTVQFPLDKPIPYGLVSRIVKFRLKEAAVKAKPKARVDKR
jgi:uncharacterized protein YdhG (YjbR/CyaY superfamily)